MNPLSEQIAEISKLEPEKRDGCFDPTLCLVINPEQCANGDPVDTAIQAASGGVTAIQIRSKTLEFRPFVKIVERIMEALNSHNVTVFVNDRVDVASTTRFCGVHLGQDDMPVSAAREILGEHAQIGLTVRSMDEARNALLEQLTYVSIGGVFPTASKLNPDPPIGLDKLKEIIDYLRTRNPTLPIIAISGINEDNVDSVLRTGVDGVAVIAAICEANNPELAARRLRSTINRMKGVENCE